MKRMASGVVLVVLLVAVAAWWPSAVGIGLHEWLGRLTTSAKATVTGRRIPPTPTLWPSATPVAAVGLPSPWQAGINVLVEGTDPAYHIKIPALMDRLKADNVTAVSVAIPIYQDSISSITLSLGPKTPTDDLIATMIAQAHIRGLAVMLRPLVDETSLHNPRSGLMPSDPGAWFQSYTALIAHYAKLAETNRAEAFVVGTEFTTMEQLYPDRWRQTIAAVRALYSGKITYDSIARTPPAFSNALDFVGVDTYPVLNVDPGTTAQLSSAYAAWFAPIARAFEATRKPVVIGEVGTRPQQGAQHQTWLWEQGTPLDLGIQQRYYQAVCAAAKQYVQGVYWWETSLDVPPPDDPGFSPLNKPSEQVMAGCHP